MLNEKRALIDKCKFGNVFIEAIANEADLIDQGKLYTAYAKDEQGNDYPVYKLNMKESNFNLKTGFSSYLGAYATLQTTITDNGFGNLICKNVEEYTSYLNSIKDDLARNYDVFIDISNITLNELEINRTFEINSEMSDYQRVFALLMAVIPSKTQLKVETQYTDRKSGKLNINTYYATSKRKKTSKCFTQLKWYNKTEQLDTCYRIVLNKSYVRLEITLHGSQKIKRELGSNRWSALTDEKINAWFDGKIQDWIVKPIQSWKEDQYRYIFDLINEHRKTDGYKWVNRCLTRILDAEITPASGYKPILLDVHELLPVINDLYENGNRRKRVKNAFTTYAERDASNLTHRDDLKLEEIIDKLTAKESVEESSLCA